MPKNRFFSDQIFKKDRSILIDKKEAIHIKQIMRKKKKDLIEIINGKGYLAKAEIINITKDFIEVKIKNITFVEEEKRKIILIQSITKNNKLDLILEKCTELGVSQFWFFKSQNAKKINFSKNRLDRIQNILIAASKQCSRLYLPKIKFLKSLEDLKDKKGLFLLGDIKNNNKIHIQNNKNIFFIIGNESGFTKKELDFFLKVLKAKKVTLNNNILRAETAAIASIAIINHFLQS